MEKNNKADSNLILKPKKPKIGIGKLRKIIFFGVLIFVIFSLGFASGKSGIQFSSKKGKIEIQREIPNKYQDIDFSLFWKTWDTLEKDYFDKEKLDSSQMVLGAIKGLVSAVGDPYTVFLPPDENKVVQEDLQGTFEGVGIQIGFKGIQLVVISPLPNTPAEEAGIKAGDYIIGIEDKQKQVDRGTSGITLPEAVELIRGKAGTVVTLTLLRGDSEEPIVVDVTRRAIDVPSIIVTILDENGEVDKENGIIARMNILKFSGETVEEWDRQVREILKNQNITKIILDLRNNPGGYLQAAVDIAGDFLPLNSVAVIEENADGVLTEFKVERLGKLLNVKTVILVNKGSASASEILAGALRDNKKIQLVGETTFGKGTIQEPVQLNGAGLHITTARWLTPSKTWVNDNGLKPDIEIEDDIETAEDEQLQKAIEVLKG